MSEGRVQTESPPPHNFKASAERENKFRKTFEAIKGLCHVKPIKGLKRLKTGKADDDDQNDKFPEHYSSS
jgi:hypothetical protein